MNALWLLLKNLVFTLVVPGFVAGWVPLHWFERYPHWPDAWGARQFGGAAAFGLGVLVFLHCQWLFATRGQGTPAPIDFRPLIRGIVRDLQAGDSRHAIASRFHNTIAAVIVEVCRRIRDADRLQRVCLSGGTFQNVYLLERAVRLLRAGDFEVFLHSAVPPNDGGIALGQAVIANAMLQGA